MRQDREGLGFTSLPPGPSGPGSSPRETVQGQEGREGSLRAQGGGRVGIGERGRGGGLNAERGGRGHGREGSLRAQGGGRGGRGERARGGRSNAERGGRGQGERSQMDADSSSGQTDSRPSSEPNSATQQGQARQEKLEKEKMEKELEKWKIRAEGMKIAEQREKNLRRVSSSMCRMGKKAFAPVI